MGRDDSGLRAANKPDDRLPPEPLSAMPDPFPDPCQHIGAHTREVLISPAACPALGDLGIRLCGRSDARPGFRFVRAEPRMRQVMACVGGQGAVWIADGWQVLEPDRAYVTESAAPHAYHADQAKPWRLIWVIWESTEADATPPRLGSADGKALAAAIDGLHREVISARDPLLMTQWAGLVDAIARRIATGTGDPVLTVLWELVAAELEFPWTLERLAERSGLHPETLRRRCQQAHGVSPMRRVSELRLARAAALLASGASRIGEIAAAVGYGDPFAFSTAFRRRFGHPPSGHRIRPIT